MIKIEQDLRSGRWLVYEGRHLVGTLIKERASGRWVAKTADGDEEGRYLDFMEGVEALQRFDERLRRGY